MARPKSNKRDDKVMQYEPLPPGVYEALDAEAWFRRIYEDVPARRRRLQQAGEAAQNKDRVFEEAVRWFLDQHREGPTPEFVAVRGKWKKTAYWLPKSLSNECKLLAERIGVNKNQVLATALVQYCARWVPKEFLEFRAHTFEQARAMYQQHRASVRVTSRSKK